MAHVRKHLAGLRRRVRLARFLAGVARLGAYLALAAGSTYLLDRALQPPVGARAGLLCFLLAGFLWVARRTLWRPLTRPLPDALLARGAEARHPAFREALVSAADFERALAEEGRFPESPALAREVIAAAEKELEHWSLARVVSWRRPLLELLLAGLLLTAVGLALTAPGAHGSVWFRRWLLLARDTWPRRTELAVLLPPAGSSVYTTREGELTVFHVPQGLDFTVHVVALRGDPPEVRLHFRPLPGARGGATGVRIVPRVQAGRYTTTFPRLARGFAFYVTGGDDQDEEPRYAVRVHEAPALARLVLTVRPPAYTGRPARTVQGGDAEVPANSRVQVELEATQPLAAAVLVPAGGPPRSLRPLGPKRFAGTLTVRKDLEYGFRLRGRNRLENLEKLLFRLTVVPDRAPRVAWLEPRGTVVRVTPRGVLPLLAVVKDDYGLTDLRFLVAARGQERALPVTEGERFGQDDDLDGRRGFYVYRQAEVKGLFAPPLKAGDSLRLSLEATDNRHGPDGSPRPQTGRSREVRVEVVLPGDVERQVNDRQLQVKQTVRRLRAYQERAREEALSVLALLGAEAAEAERVENGLLEAERRQYRLTGELRLLLQEVGLNLDAYVWNRLEVSPATERLLALYATAARTRPEDGRERYRLAVAAREEGQLSSSDLLAKLVQITGLALRAAEVLSPAAAQELGAARAAGNRAACRAHLRRALHRQEEVLAALAELAAALAEWEDYQEVVQLNKELIQLQRQILERTVGLLRRGTERK